MINLYKLSKNKSLLSVVLSVFIFVFISYIISFASLNKIIHSNLLKISDKELSQKVSKDIVIVGIDEKTLQNLGRFPFARDAYVKVINNLNARGASVIGLDIIFADKSNPIKDKEFAEGIKQAGNIVLGGSILGGNEIELPLKEFYESAEYFGFFTQDYENSFKVIHRFFPFKKLILNGKEKLFDNFSIAVLKAYYANMYKNKEILSNIKYNDKYYKLSPTRDIPFSGRGQNILISFAPQSSFSKISFIDAYNAENLDLVLEHLNIDLENKIILIGTNAKGLKDIFNTPNGVDYGVYVHANIINTVLKNNFYSYFNENLEYLLIFLLIIVSFYLNLSKGGYLVIFSNIALIAIFLIIFPSILYSWGLILNHPADLAASLVFSLFLANTVKYLIEDKNKKKLMKALGEFVAKDIAKEILSESGKIKLDGEKKKISIFFSDIKGFTSISEKLSPEELVSFLKEYLGAMSHIIMDERGLIDKYEGDAIMALFGVFGYEESSSYDNCKSAILQQKKLKQLNLIWGEKYGQSLEVRMGLHTGDVIIGNIGAQGRKIEFTALGDAVNLASRLEGVNKFYGTNICVSESIFLETKDDFEFRKLDKIRVKGKQKPVIIYELLGFKEETSKLKKDIITKFERALDLYFSKEFKKAQEIFAELKKLGDKPSEIFEKRCEELSLKYEVIISREGWDGVWEMKQK